MPLCGQMSLLGANFMRNVHPTLHLIIRHLLIMSLTWFIWKIATFARSGMQSRHLMCISCFFIYYNNAYLNSHSSLHGVWMYVLFFIQYNCISMDIYVHGFIYPWTCMCVYIYIYIVHVYICTYVRVCVYCIHFSLRYL